MTIKLVYISVALISCTIGTMSAISFDEYVASKPVNAMFNYAAIVNQVKMEHPTAKDEELIGFFDQAVVAIEQQANKAQGCKVK